LTHPLKKHQHEPRRDHIDARNALMVSRSKPMTNEKSKWTKLENKYSAACEQLQKASRRRVSCDQDVFAKPAHLRPSHATARV